MTSDPTTGSGLQQISQQISQQGRQRGALRALVATWPAWSLPLLASAALVNGLASVWDAQGLMHLAVWLVLGLVALPLSFAAGLAAVGAALVLVLGALSLPARIAGRRVGLRGVARDAFGLAGSILPRYWGALCSVRRPWLWGAVVGYVLGITLRLMAVGLGAA